MEGKNAVLIQGGRYQTDVPFLTESGKTFGKRRFQAVLREATFLQFCLFHLVFNALHFLFIFCQGGGKSRLRVKASQRKQWQGEPGEHHDADDDPRILFISSLRQEAQDHLSGQEKNGNAF